ncbi:MAG: NACHT domain-containing protein, partial [Desulfobacterales bacterium]|nr:NACHT domain-containing protein [Desulfobacterales bacterium]
MVILGDPGSGKTTHLKRLALWCLRGGTDRLGLPGAMLPVFLPLRDLEDLSRGLDAFIEEQLDQPHLGVPKGFGKRLMKRGNLLFLFDGLDEVADLSHRGKVADWIEKALRVNKTCRFVVTCRFAGYSPEVRLGEDFIEMHMRPLTTDQAETFIHNWYKIVETGLHMDREQAEVFARERADNLVARLREPEFRARRVFELTRNPLLLTNLCLVHRDRGNLPRSRARLYEECTDVLLELWHGAVGLESRVTARAGRRVLQPAALWLHEKEGRTKAGANELSPVIEPALKSVGWTHGSAKEFLKIVRDESGLLTGWDQERFGFMHLGFQEYLAAREIRSRAFKGPKVLRELAAH